MKHEITSMQTKLALSSSLKKLMRKKALSKITVTDIITDCAVNRKTFYYHFQDIYDLLRWTFEQESGKIIEQFDLAIEFDEAIYFVMTYVESSDYLFRCTLDAMGLHALKTFFYDTFHGMIRALIDIAEQNAGKHLDEKHKKFLCVFYTNALEGILMDWFASQYKVDKHIVSDFVQKTVIQSLEGILQAQPSSDSLTVPDEIF